MKTFKKAKIFQWHSIKTKVTLLTLAIFVISLWSLSFFTSQMLRDAGIDLLQARQVPA